MSLNEDSVSVVRHAYDCFEKRDIPGLLQLIGPECDWSCPGPASEMPWAGSFHGPAEVSKFFDALDRSVEFLEFAPGDFLAQNDKVMVTGHERDRVKSTGKTYEVDWAHYFEVKNGKIVNFRDYQDTAAIVAALH
jgi:ketosteroid isomerase-like protein